MYVVDLQCIERGAEVKGRDLAFIAVVVGFVACVVVPPPQEPGRGPAQQPPSGSNCGAMGGAGYGGASYGGETCASWIGDSCTNGCLGTNIGPGMVGVGASVIVANQNAPDMCGPGLPCAPAVGATVTLTNLSSGAVVASGSISQTGSAVVPGVVSGDYRVRVEYRGAVVERVATISTAGGAAFAAVFGAGDVR